MPLVLRALWVLWRNPAHAALRSTSTGSSSATADDDINTMNHESEYSVLLSRRWPTAEARAARLHGCCAPQPVPGDEVVCALVAADDSILFKVDECEDGDDSDKQDDATAKGSSRHKSFKTIRGSLPRARPEGAALVSALGSSAALANIHSKEINSPENVTSRYTHNTGKIESGSSDFAPSVDGAGPCPCSVGGAILDPLVSIQRGPFRFLALPLVDDTDRWKRRRRCGRSNQGGEGGASACTGVSESCQPPWLDSDEVLSELVAAEEFLQDFALIALTQFGFIRQLPPDGMAVAGAAAPHFFAEPYQSNNIRPKDANKSLSQVDKAKLDDRPEFSGQKQANLQSDASLSKAFAALGCGGALYEETCTDALTLAACAAAADHGPPSLDQIMELGSMLAYMAPFGTPVDTSIANARGALERGFGAGRSQVASAGPISNIGAAIAAGSKQPAYRPFGSRIKRGDQRLALVIRETIGVVQYDKEKQFGIPDAHKISGQILGTADVDEAFSEIRCTAYLPSASERGNGAADNITLSKCTTVDRAASAVAANSSTDPNAVQTLGRGSVPLLFRPAFGEFELARYAVNSVEHIPVRGFFQLRDADTSCCKILIQLKLHDFFSKTRNANSFAYCACEIRFPGKGAIAKVELAPTAGTVTLSPDRFAILWDIGSKFTARNAEVALPATVFFGNSDEAAQATSAQLARRAVQAYGGDTTSAAAQMLSATQTEQFLEDGNSFVILRYQLLGSTISGANIDSKSVEFDAAEVSAGRRTIKGRTPPITITNEVNCPVHIIWNSHARRVEHA